MGDPEREPGGSEAPGLPLCLDFPMGVSKRESARSWAPPCQCFSWSTGTRTLRVSRPPQPAHKLGGSAHVAGPTRGFQFCSSPTSPTRDSGGIAPFPLSLSQVPKTRVTNRGPSGQGHGDRSAQPVVSVTCFYVDGAPYRLAPAKLPRDVFKIKKKVNSGGWVESLASEVFLWAQLSEQVCYS